MKKEELYSPKNCFENKISDNVTVAGKVSQFEAGGNFESSQQKKNVWS